MRGQKLVAMSTEAQLDGGSRAALSRLVSGFVLAGGASRRMRVDKAMLPWGAGTLLDHAVARLAAATDDVRVLCGETPRYSVRGIPLVCDRRVGSGPLGGLEAALLALERPYALLLAVDLPLVPEGLLVRLVERAAQGGASVVLAASSRGPEPLCAVYGREILADVKAALDSGRLAMGALLDGLSTVCLSEGEVAALGDPERIFANVNAPSDLARVRRIAEARSSPGLRPTAPGRRA